MYTSFGELTDIFPLGIYLEVQDHREYQYSALADTAKQFSKVDVPFYNLSSRVWVRQGPYTLSSTWNCLSVFSHCGRWHVSHLKKKKGLFIEEFWTYRKAEKMVQKAPL